MILANPFEQIVLRQERIEAYLIEIKSQLESALGDTSKRWMSIDELCEYLPNQPKKSTIYAKVSKRGIPFSKEGKFLVFDKHKIDEWYEGKHKNTNEKLRHNAHTKLRK